MCGDDLEMQSVHRSEEEIKIDMTPQQIDDLIDTEREGKDAKKNCLKLCKLKANFELNDRDLRIYYKIRLQYN